ncbi:MAG TPA: hypothetical protein DC057_14420 [Spirochaetia bacterium]|nr:hypothetical protein [Spirochaetia bacterium]
MNNKRKGKVKMNKNIEEKEKIRLRIQTYRINLDSGLYSKQMNNYFRKRIKELAKEIKNAK